GRTEQLRDRPGAVFVIGCPVTHDRRDRAVARDRTIGIRRYAAELVVALIDDQQRAVAGERYARRLVQLRRARRAAVAQRSRGPGARDGRDDAARVDLPHPVVAEVGDVEVPRRIERDARRVVDARIAGRTAVAARTRKASAREGGDHAA